jgi:hypothetical protein
MPAERIDSILKLTALFGLSTPGVLHRVLFGDEVTPKAVERCVTRALQQGLLRSYPLHGKNCYYVLTDAGERQIGVESKRAGQPFGWQGLIRAYATLLYCTAGPGRKKITRRDFEEKFPALKVPGLPAGAYFLDSDPQNGRVRLGIICADQGAGTRRLVRRVRNEVERRRKHAVWAEYLRHDHLAVALVTATPEKAERLRRALSGETFTVRVEAIPALLDLMAKEERR